MIGTGDYMKTTQANNKLDRLPGTVANRHIDRGTMESVY